MTDKQEFAAENLKKLFDGLFTIEERGQRVLAAIIYQVGREHYINEYMLAEKAMFYNLPLSEASKRKAHDMRLEWEHERIN